MSRTTRFGRPSPTTSDAKVTRAPPSAVSTASGQGEQKKRVASGGRALMSRLGPIPADPRRARHLVGGATSHQSKPAMQIQGVRAGTPVGLGQNNWPASAQAGRGTATALDANPASVARGGGGGGRRRGGGRPGSVVRARGRARPPTAPRLTAAGKRRLAGLSARLSATPHSGANVQVFQSTNSEDHICQCGGKLPSPVSTRASPRRRS